MSSPMAFPPPVDPNDPGRGPMLAKVTWTFTSFAILAVCLRLYVRKKIGKAWGWDDGVMAVALMFQIANSACVQVALNHGLGKHDASLQLPDQMVEVLKWDWIASTPGIVASIVARISITILLIRIFGVHVWFKRFLITFTTLVAVSGVLVIITVWAQASPVQGLWNIYLPPSQVRRWNPDIELYCAYLSQSIITFTDLTYVLLPVAIIWKLNLSLARRIGLIALMCGSLFTMTMSIMKVITAESGSHPSKNVEYNSSLAVLWSVLEQTCVIIMGCVPPLGGLFKLPVVNTITSSMVSLISKAKSRSLRSDKESQDSTYRDLERDTYDLGSLKHYPGYKVSGPTVTHYSHEGSESDLVPQNEVRRTDQFTLEVSQDKP